MSPRLGEWSLIRIISSHLATSSHTSDTHSRYTHQPWSRSYQHLGKLANICSGCCSKLQLQMSRILCSTFTFCLPTSTTCLYLIYATALLLTVLMCWLGINHLLDILTARAQQGNPPCKSPCIKHHSCCGHLGHVILVMPKLVWGQWGSRRLITATSTTITR